MKQLMLLRPPRKLSEKKVSLKFFFQTLLMCTKYSFSFQFRAINVAKSCQTPKLERIVSKAAKETAEEYLDLH